MNRPAGLRLKRPRNSKLDTPRKKQKVTHVIQAFSVRDTAYRPPSVRSQQTSETPVRLPRTIQNKVFRTAKKNRRDPFHTLDDDVVYQIISLLPAKDTETLRRVSKLWRSSSEYHCGKVALLKQFPWAKPEIDMSATQEDLNLLYRRHLYHRECMISGEATRAIKCEKVQDWHIADNSLIWVGSPETNSQISIGSLKKPNGVSTKSFDTMEIEIDWLSSKRGGIKYVQMTHDGDLLLRISAFPFLYKCRRSGGEPAIFEGLLKMSLDNVCAWKLKLRASINRPAIGRDAIYFIRAKDTPSTVPSKRIKARKREKTFYKVSLKDGSIVYSVPFATEDGSSVSVPFLENSMSLTSNEEFAIWDSLDGKAYVFSTASGAVLHTFKRSGNGPLVSSATKNKIWDINIDAEPPHWTSKIVTLNKDEKTIVEEPLHLPSLASQDSWCFDGDRQLMCVFEHPEAKALLDFPEQQLYGVRLGIRDSFSLIGVRIVEECPPPRSILQYRESAHITLPPHAGRGPNRRLLELELPWEIGMYDYFGMCEGYLVFHNRTEQTLILVDFWPTW